MARYGGRLADHGHSPYDRATLFAVEQELLAGVDEMPFYDPPPTAAAFRLISHWPLEGGALAWKLLSVVCLAVIGWMLADLVRIAAGSDLPAGHPDQL